MHAFLAFARSCSQEASSAAVHATAADPIVAVALLLCVVSLAAAVVTGGLVLALTVSAGRGRSALALF
jgi:hypothetical protein